MSRAALRYLLVGAARTRAALVPIAAGVFVLIGVYASPRNEVGATFALTAVLSCALAAWLVGAVLAAEPRPQADMATAALGGQRGRVRLDGRLIMLVASGLTAAFVAYPLALDTVVDRVFEAPVKAGDVVAATLAHLSCALLGGAIALLFAPPRVTRRATGIALVLAVLLGLVAISRPLGALGGPLAVAEALSDSAPGTVGGEVLLSCVTCVALAAGAAVAAPHWAARSG